MGKVMALDIGERRIGVAVSDALGVLAQPLTVVQRQGVAKDVAQLVRLAQEQGAETLVVGLPLTLRGERAQAVEQVEAFVTHLRKALDVPVVLVDERLSTAEAERCLREAELSRAKRKQQVDAVAAALILERYLHRQRGGANGGAGQAP